MKFKFYAAFVLFAIYLALPASADTKNNPVKKSKKEPTAEKKKNAEKPLVLDQVLANYYEAIGGLEKWQNLNTMIMRGTMQSQGRSMPITAYQQKPNKCRVEYKIKQTMMAQIYNGVFGWQINPLSGNPEPTPMSKGQTIYLKDTCDIENTLVDYNKKGHKVSLLGQEEIEGKKTYKINVKFQSGNIETYYLDAATYLPLRVTGIYDMDGKEIRTTRDFSNYQNHQGYVVPHVMKIDIHGAPGQEILTIKSFVFNTKINPKMFDFPKEKMMNPSRNK